MAGKYRLHVATAKSKQEAIRIASRVRKLHRGAIGKSKIDIDPVAASGGGRGSYTVRLGPYADANEPRNLCVKLRQSGYNCELLTQ